MHKSFSEKLIHIFSSFLLLFNYIATPLLYAPVVSAQDATSAPETVEQTSTQNTDAPQATIEATQESVLVEPAPTQLPQIEASIVPSPTPKEETETGNETLTADVLSETTGQQEGTQDSINDLPDTDLDTPQEDSSAQLSPNIYTDKADYAPTDVAVISGSGLLPNTEYEIVITSETGNFRFSDRVTSNESGAIFYTYQLDGTYRPNYEVEVLLNGILISIVSFTDSHISSHECTDDLQGANDEPGQKDLTKMCVNETNLPTSIQADWNWDDTGWTGSNTGDACALFDTDNDGLANFASCVTVENDPAVQKSTSPRIFTCNDTRFDRCAGPTLVTGPYTSVCTVNITTDQPFVTGDDTPNDTQASCTIQMSEVGGVGTAVLIDVCSFPSDNPNSDPSDCIIFEPGTARLEVVKDLVPSIDTGLFNLQIDGVTQASNVSDGGTTGEKLYEVSKNGTTFTVGETAGTGTSLANYTTAISCRDLNGTGAVVASSSDSGPLNVLLEADDDVVCTITNTLQNGTIIVHKDVQGPNGESIIDTSNNFTVQLDGANSQSFTDGGTVTYNNVVAGSHTVTESIVASGYSLYGIGLVAGTSGNAGGLSTNVVAGQTTHVYVTNRQQNATITVIKDVLDPDGNQVSDTHKFTVDVGSDSDEIGEGDNGVFTVIPGTYLITEDPDSDYDFVSITPDEDAQTGGVQVIVGPGETQTVYVTNKQKKATINVTKDVLRPDGTTDVSDNHGFTVQLNGGTNKALSEQTSAQYLVNPGSPHTIAELNDPNYSELGCYYGAAAPVEASNMTLTSNQIINVLCKNKQIEASITVVKDVVKYDGSPVDDANIFSVLLNSEIKDFAEGNSAVFSVWPGTYGAFEQAELNYSEVSNDGPATVGSNGSATITIVNRQDPGSIFGYKFDADESTVLSGWEIKLYSCLADFLTCSFVTSDFTDANGYSFEDLNTGYYKVEEVLQLGWTQLSPLSPNYYTITINPGTESTDNDFINFQLGQITVCKFEDTNDNNQVDGDDTALSGISMILSQASNPLATKETGELGCVTFDQLSAGTYRVEEDYSDSDLADYYSTDGVLYHDVEIVSGSDETRNFLNTHYRTISGTKFNDFNANGVQDPGEPGIEGWTIYLDFFPYGLDSGDIVTTTDVNGYYEFSGLAADSYTVAEDLKSGWEQTYPLGGTHDVDVHFDVTSSGNDFGNFELGIIRVCKYDDVDGDGVLQEQDQPLSGVYIELFKESDGWQSINNDLTQENGCVDFGNLEYGNYRVGETVPNGYYQTYPSNPEYHDNILVESGYDNTSEPFLFLNTVYSTLGDFIYNDLNNNGDDDLGEPGITGVDVTLYKDDGDGIFDELLDTLIDTETSDGTGGEYKFIDLEAGKYWVVIDESTFPLGFVLTTPSIYEVDLVPGDNYLDADYGLLEPVRDISLAKSNNKPTASAGDTVTYTLTLKNTGNVTLNNVEVTDILPSGFSYVAGSATPDVDSVNGQILTWQIASITADEEITITYDAKIADDQKAAKYTNLAVCTAGYGRVLNLTDNIETNGIVDENSIECNDGVPVRSDVSLGLSNEYGGNITPQVLGAATELPATGSPTIILLVVLLLLGLGLILRANDKISFPILERLLKIAKKGTKVSLLLFVIAGALMVRDAKAVTTTVDISDLPEYTNKDNFVISYTAISDDPGSITAQFYYWKDGEGQTALGPVMGGPSNKFDVSGTQINENNKKYYFKVVLGSGEMDQTSIIYDNSGPGEPGSYSKERLGPTTFKIKWHSPNSDDFATVVVYRGEAADFHANSASEVARVGGEKDKDYEWVDNGVSPDKTYYYLLRALDKAGNTSNLVGDVSTTTTSSSAPAGQVAGTSTTTGEVRQLPKESSEGEVLSEETQEMETPVPAMEEGSDSMSEQIAEFAKNRTKLMLGIVALLLVAGYFGYRFWKNKNK